MKLTKRERAILTDALMVFMHERERLQREGTNAADPEEDQFEQGLLERLMSEHEPW